MQKTQKGALHNDKGTIYQDDILVINNYAANTRAPQYIKQILRSWHLVPSLHGK